MNKGSRVAIILVNYRGWEDTIECLESIFKLSYHNFFAVVVDNQSGDASLDHIANWARGELELVINPPRELHSLVYPPTQKPISYQIVVPAKDYISDPTSDSPTQLYLLQAQQNRGFAAGNNIGIQFAIDYTDADFIWLLNNDTVVDHQALAALIEHAQSNDQPSGIVGSTLRFYHDSETMQAYGGGSYNRWFAISKHLGEGDKFDENVAKSITESHSLDYVNGASMLVSRGFIREVGMMSESYFLYFEETDWETRARKQNLRCEYAYKSIVYHKQGRTIGTNDRSQSIPLSALFYFHRNRLQFTRKYFPYALPTVWLAFLLAIGKRLLQGKFREAILQFQILTGRQRY